MDMVTRNNGSDSAQAAPSQTKPAWSALGSDVASSSPDEVTRIRNALDLAMQELDNALQLKRTLRARVAEMCRSEPLAA